MKNRSLIIYGKTWGERLQRRLGKAPVGLERWVNKHTETLEEKSYVLNTSYMMRDMPTYLQFYRRSTPLHLLLYVARRGRPLRLFKTAVLFSANGVPVPRPLACLVVGRGVLVLSEGHYGGGNYCDLWEASPSQEEAQRMMHGAGQTIGAAHVAGFTHGACQWSNLFWSEETCYLMDLDGARKRRIMADYFKARDLARFTVSAEEAGVRPEILDKFLESYILVTQESREALVVRMRPHLDKLHSRHFEKYGIAAQPLI
jgi:tRNA A-37 threonylcarbamoyl transferase component Bud32